MTVNEVWMGFEIHLKSITGRQVAFSDTTLQHLKNKDKIILINQTKFWILDSEQLKMHCKMALDLDTKNFFVEIKR